MQKYVYNYCPYCGKELPDSNKSKANYCCYCGRELRNNKKRLNKGIQCTICHKYINSQNTKTITCSFCGSMYHYYCISSWLIKYNACPMCQNVFLNPNLIQLNK
ncbi:MAG: RING finger domain-containing protein [Promethearchaeota archaeon]